MSARPCQVGWILLDHSYGGKYWSLVAWGWEYSVFTASPSACYSAFNPSVVLLPVENLSCILNVAPLRAPGVTWCRVRLYLRVMFQRRNCLTVHLRFRCITVGWMALSVSDACQTWDLTEPLVGATLSFLPGSEHSSSIHYPMSLCCWDKVFFVCLRLLARAHRALKLRLNDGVFISIPPFRAHSHPSVLSH